MTRCNWMLLDFIPVLTVALTVSIGCAVQEGKKEEKQAKAKLPDAVAKAIQENYPDAEIDKMELETEAGITLYDIEFKADKGEIEVALDGTVMDIATVVQMKDIPKAAAEVIGKAAEGAQIQHLEKSEIRAEIDKGGEKGKVTRLTSPRYVYEAELVKGDRTGEIEVAADGKVIEALKWEIKGAREKKERQE
jgi:uncharacterized membrane protein YkoI